MLRNWIIGIGGGLALIYLAVWGWLFTMAHTIHNGVHPGDDVRLMAIITDPAITYHMMPPGIDIHTHDGPALRLRLTTLGPQLVIRDIHRSVDFSTNRLNRPWADLPYGDVTFSNTHLHDGDKTIIVDGYRDTDGDMDLQFDYQSPFVHVSGSGQGQWEKSLTMDIKSIRFQKSPAVIKRSTGWINWLAGDGITGQIQAGLFQIGGDMILHDPNLQLSLGEGGLNLSIRGQRLGDHIFAAELIATDQLELNIKPGDLSMGHMTWIDPTITIHHDPPTNKWSGMISAGQRIFDHPIRNLNADLNLTANLDNFSFSWQGDDQSGRWNGWPGKGQTDKRDSHRINFRDISLPIGDLKRLSITDGGNITARTEDGYQIDGQINGDQFTGGFSDGSLTLDLNYWSGQATTRATAITTDQIVRLFGPLPVSQMTNGMAVFTTDINYTNRQTMADIAIDQLNVLDQTIGPVTGMMDVGGRILNLSYATPARSEFHSKTKGKAKAKGRIIYAPTSGWVIKQSVLGGEISCEIESFDEPTLCNADVSGVSLDRVLNLTTAHMLEASGKLNGTVEFIRDGDYLKIGAIELSGTTGALSLVDGKTFSGEQSGVNDHLKNLALDEIKITQREQIMDKSRNPIQLTANGHRPDGRAVNLTLHLDIHSDQLDRLME